jgi:hypothetical protein
MIESKEEKVCGLCVHMKYEGIDGWGQCIYARGGLCHCSDLCSSLDRGKYFVSESTKRHYMAVLRKCQRCLGKNVGTVHDLDVQSISEAIDFLVEYSKIY